MHNTFISAAARPYLAAIFAVVLWATQASLAASLADVPPFLLTGLALLFGGLPALPKWRSWSRSPAVYGVGIYGIFIYHLLYFVALRTAPSVEANLIQYLWPSFIVLFTPLFFKQLKLKFHHFVGVALGLSGSALVIFTGASGLHPQLYIGYFYALAAAVVWATFSLQLKKMPVHSSWTTGAFCLISGVLSILLHILFEPSYAIRPRDLALVSLQGFGPLGCAFYLWSYSLQRGDSRIIGVLAYIIPVLSTLLLLAVTHRSGSNTIIISALLVVAGGLAVIHGAWKNGK